MTKQEFHARIWSKLLAFERDRRLIREGDGILIAVSGGPDSVCLADFLHRLAQRRRLRLGIVHFNHGLRGGAAERDARFVAALGEKLCVPVIQERIDVRGFARTSRRSLEDAGRTLRYDSLLRLARRGHYNKVATGHQLDDLAETFVLNLLRGTKAKGLAGIPPSRALSAKISVIRPLLLIRREDVLAYLRHHRLAYRSDSTNRSTDFTRNWVRHKALPLLEKKSPRLREHLASIAEEVRGLL